MNRMLQKLTYTNSAEINKRVMQTNDSEVILKQATNNIIAGLKQKVFYAY